MAARHSIPRARCRGAVALWLAIALVWLGVPALPAAAAAIETFTVTVEGIADGGLRQAVLNVSQLTEDARRSAATERALRRRVEASIPRVDKLLRSRGYYAAKITFAIERTGETGRKVVLRIAPGPAYRLARFEIVPTTPDGRPVSLDVPLKTLGIVPGDVALADRIVEADSKLLAKLAQQAYPLARIRDRKVVVDHASQSVSVTVSVDTGPYARFGPTRTEGLRDVDPSLIERHLSWTRGAPFDPAALEETRRKLRETGLFASVSVRHGDALDDRGELPITVVVEERKHRSVGAGGSFSTTEGVLGKAFWEHRNLGGHGERLRVRAEVGNIRQGVFGDLRIPDVGTIDQDVVVDMRATKEQPDGFTSVETAAVARLERRFAEMYAGSAGFGFDRSSVEENEFDRNFSFIVLPLTLRRDTADDILDPGSGSRHALSFTPHLGILGTDSTFFSTQLFDTVYLPILPEKKLILAGWARIGTIFGERTVNIPANKRRYAGGPGSVRGYALNSIGPLDAQNDPVGGRSSTGFGAELRWKVFGPFGMVAFAEAGGVYDDAIPDWGQDLQWGTGLGVRYQTPIGPIRLDVAVPLNRRNEVDDAFQILISLGQAF
jgi:translocation and assembly module TamA